MNGLSARLKSCPVTKHSKPSFSAACKAAPLQSAPLRSGRTSPTNASDFRGDQRGPGRSAHPPVAVAIVGRVSPVHVRQEDRLIDAIAVLQRDADHRIQQRIGQQMRLQAQVDQLRVLGVVVMRFRLDARIGQVLDLSLQAQLRWPPTAPSAPVPAPRTAR